MTTSCPIQETPDREGRQTLLSEEGAEVQAEQALLHPEEIIPGTMLDSGEIVILAIKPSVWFLMLVSVRWLLAAAAVIILAPWLKENLPFVSVGTLTQAALIFTAGRLLVALLQWSSRLYVLTNRRVMSCHGILSVQLFEAPLVNIRNTYLDARTLQRLLGVGSIGFSLQGSRRVDSWWHQIGNPEEVHAQVRRAIEKALDRHLPY